VEGEAERDARRKSWKHSAMERFLANKTTCVAYHPWAYELRSRKLSIRRVPLQLLRTFRISLFADSRLSILEQNRIGMHRFSVRDRWIS